MLGLTPAYVKGVVTFYTMYHTHPVGRHFIQVCTTSPCNICGAEDVVKALLEASGCGELGATSPDGRFTVIEVECLGACGFATPILVDDDFIESVTPEQGPRHPAEVSVMGYPHPSHPKETVVLSQYFGDAEARTYEGWVKRGGYEALRKALGMTPRGDRGRGEGVGTPRPRRRRLPDRPQVVVHAEGGRQAALPGLQRRRVASRARSRTARSCAGRRTP